MNGFVHSNYAGITGAQLNPTALVNSKLYFDANIIGLHIFGDNNAVYLGKETYKFTRFFESGAEFPTHPVEISPNRTEDREFYDYYNTSLKNAFVQAKILGPGVMFSKNNKAFGISTAMRSIVSADNVPYEMAKFGVEGFDFYPQHRIRFDNEKDVRAAALSFGELALTYSQVLYKQNLDHLSGGITVKGLLGMGGAYWYIDNVSYMLPNDDTLVVYNANGRAGVSAPLDYATNDVNFGNPLVLGSGVGFDIGFTYQKKMKGHTNKRYSACEQPFEDYYYSIGFSLLDIGYVSFKKNIKQIELVDAQGQWNDFTNLDIEYLDQLFNQMTTTFHDPSIGSLTTVNEESFRVYLPAAASFQFDYRMNEQTYINASVVLPLIHNESMVVRPSQVSVTPRIERDRFEIAVPITVYNFRYPRLGISARFSNFVIGTDKLGSFFGFNDFTGTDLYFMVKIPLIKGFCIGKGRGVNCGNHEYRQYQRSSERLKVRLPY